MLEQPAAGLQERDCGEPRDRHQSPGIDTGRRGEAADARAILPEDRCDELHRGVSGGLEPGERPLRLDEVPHESLQASVINHHHAAVQQWLVRGARAAGAVSSIGEGGAPCWIVEGTERVAEEPKPGAPLGFAPLEVG